MPGEAETWSAWFREHGAGLLLFARQTVPDLAAAEAGFALSSKFKYKDVPVTLTIGPKAK